MARGFRSGRRDKIRLFHPVIIFAVCFPLIEFLLVPDIVLIIILPGILVNALTRLEIPFPFLLISGTVVYLSCLEGPVIMINFL